MCEVVASTLRCRSESDGEFTRTLEAFVATLDELDAVAAEALSEAGALAAEDVGCDAVLRQPGLGCGGLDAQLDVLYARAAAADEVLASVCRDVLRHVGVDADREVARVTRRPEKGGGFKVIRAYLPTPLKGRDRAAEKARNEYGGDAAGLLDVVRASLVCDDEAAVRGVVEHILDAYSGGDGAVRVLRYKNRFRKKTFNGYRDGLFNLLVAPPGVGGAAIVVEVQVHLLRLFEFKRRTHAYYEYFRTYFRGNRDRGKYDAAEPHFRGAVAALEAALGDDHPDVAASRATLGRFLEARDEYT